jgi:hypothetical protein
MKHLVLQSHSTYNVEQWSIQDIIDCINSPENKIQIQPPEFQRDFVAPLEWSQNLIDSFYNGASSNLIHFRRLSDEKAKKVGFKYQCLDGLQRVTSTVDFINNKYPDNDGKFFRELSKEKKQSILNYTFVLFVYNEQMTDEEAGETFCRINNANDLNDQEKNNAIPGYVSQVIRSLSRTGEMGSKLPIFETYIDNKDVRRNMGSFSMLPGVRMAYDAILARWFAIEYDKQRHPLNTPFSAGGINKKLVAEMYRDPAMKCQYDSDGNPIYLGDYTWTQPKEFATIEKEVTRRAKYVYDWIQADPEHTKKVFKNPGTINILYDLSYALEDQFGKNCVKDCKKFIRGVMKIISNRRNSKENELYFQRILGCGTAHEIVEKVMWFIDEFKEDPMHFGIVGIDHGKISDADKMKILVKQKFKCWVDEEDATIDELEAAHIQARALGGKNVIDNYVLVRKQYNRSMGTMTPLDYKAIYYPHLLSNNA